jgi:hypothetical protein
MALMGFQRLGDQVLKKEFCPAMVLFLMFQGQKLLLVGLMKH